MLSVICPFYNERDNLKMLYAQARKALEPLGGSWELIFVDDGSTDGGAEIVRTMLPAEGSVRLIILDGRYGKDKALYEGFRAARGELVATIDADLQLPPFEIPRMLKAMAGHDMVMGIRKQRHDSWMRKAASVIGNRSRRALLGDTIQDSGCSLMVCRKETLELFYPSKRMHHFFPAIAQLTGFKVAQIPVAHHNRVCGRSKFRFTVWDPSIIGIALKWRRLTKHYRRNPRSQVNLHTTE